LVAVVAAALGSLKSLNVVVVDDDDYSVVDVVAVEAAVEHDTALLSGILEDVEVDVGDFERH
jgi:hypothetical protein